MIARVDLSKLAAGALPAIARDPDFLRRAVEGLTASARAHWDLLAAQRLRATSATYRAAISPIEVNYRGVGEVVGSVMLEGVLPNMVEHGWQGGDLRASLLGPNSHRRRRKARPGVPAGWYAFIPFRHGTPGTTWRSTGVPMPKSVHDEARSLVATLSAPRRKTSWGGRLDEGLAPKLKPIHKLDPYAGMYRFRKTYARATQASYKTFRTISDRQDLRLWQHPGIKPAKLLDEVQQRIAALAPRVFAATARTA